MRTINIQQAKIHLSRLLEEAATGKPFIITRAGKPLVKVSTLYTPDKEHMQRCGFLAGQFSIPDDFDHMEQADINALFYGDR